MRVRVFYELDLDAPDPFQKDGLLEVLAGRKQDGSGSDGCTRDMDWMCPNGREAANLAKRFRVYEWADVRVEER